MEWLKEIIGEDLYNKLVEALKGKEDKVKLANLADGKYVDKEKYDKIDREHTQLKKDKKTVDDELTALKGKGLTNDEKLQAALDAAAENKKSYDKALNKLEAEKIFAKSGLKEEDYAELIDGLISEDKDATISKVNSISTLLSKQIAAREKAIKEEILKKTPKPEGGAGGGGEGGEDSLGAKLAKSAATINADSAKARETYFQ